MYDGVVTLDETDIPVIVELDDTRVRMSAGGTEIGEWKVEECRISHVSESVYTISAENETLQFVPNQPGLFAAAVNDGEERPPVVALPPEPSAKPRPTGGREAPAPRPLTMGLFYALCVLTAALAVWSLIQIVW